MYNAKLDAWVSVIWTDNVFSFYSGKLTASCLLCLLLRGEAEGTTVSVHHVWMNISVAARDKDVF
jgi:hypothetical protein